MKRTLTASLLVLTIAFAPGVAVAKGCIKAHSLAVSQVIRPVTALSRALSWAALLVAQRPKRTRKCARGPRNSVPKNMRDVHSRELPK